MKKIVIIIISILFVLFAVLGFRAAARLTPRSASQEIVEVSQLASSQKNYLLVQLTDLSGESPQLVSVWGAFVFYGDSPHIAFVPLFPNSNAEISNRLAGAFKVDKDGNLSDRFISRIQREFDIETHGYVVVDNSAMSSLSESLFNESIQTIESTPLTDDEIQQVLSTGQQFFESTCVKLKKQGVDIMLDKIDWLSLLPAHFSTNLSFESITMASESLKSAGLIENCEVLGDF
jgi:hypothetical protein